MPPASDPADTRKPREPARGTGVVELATEGGRPVRARREPRPEELPAERHARFEDLLCRAIAERVLVELRYDAEVPARLFAPHVVYRSTTGRINVSGTQLLNPGQPEDSYEPRIFEIGLIRTLRLTDTNFRPDARVDPEDPRYRNGVICAV
jgi:hypothetical protein